MLYDYRQQILIGTILGGSSLTKPPKGKNYYLSMRSSNPYWLQYKMAELDCYFPNKNLHKQGSTYRVNSRCCEALTKMHEDLYFNNSRNVTMNLLDQLKDIAIAIWYLDDGSKAGRNRKNAYINITKFKEEEKNTILRFFNEVGLECNINVDGSRSKILFTVNGTICLFKTIAHIFPKFMHERL